LTTLDNMIVVIHHHPGVMPRLSSTTT